MFSDKIVGAAFLLGICSLAALAVGHLALTDIFHGGEKLDLEWNVLRLCFVVIALFHIVALTTLWRILRRSRSVVGG